MTIIPIIFIIIIIIAGFSYKIIIVVASVGSKMDAGRYQGGGPKYGPPSTPPRKTVVPLGGIDRTPWKTAINQGG